MKQKALLSFPNWPLLFDTGDQQHIMIPLLGKFSFYWLPTLNLYESLAQSPNADSLDAQETKKAERVACHFDQIVNQNFFPSRKKLWNVPNVTIYKLH